MIKTPFVRTLLTATLAGGLVAAMAPAASAYVACNGRDCWHTDSRVHMPKVRITFHADNWRDKHARDSHYNWHENDNDHDWHHGYWDHGNWRSADNR